MKTSVIISYLFFLAFLFNCSYNSENDLVDVFELPNPVYYVDHVKSIIDNNCIDCHSNPPINNATIPLATYDEVKTAVENNNLIGLISSQDLGILMPFGGPRLPQNLIDLISKWKDDGLLEE